MIVTVVDKWSRSFAGNVGIRVVLTSGRGSVHARVPRDFCLPVRLDRSFVSIAPIKPVVVQIEAKQIQITVAEYGGEERNSYADGC